jgi:hypothetical protein
MKSNTSKNRCSADNKGAKSPRECSSKRSKTSKTSYADSVGTTSYDGQQPDVCSSKRARSKTNRQTKRMAAIGKSISHLPPTPSTTRSDPEGETPLLPPHGFENLDFKLYHGAPRVAVPILAAGAGALACTCVNFAKNMLKFVQHQGPKPAMSTVGLGIAAFSLPLATVCGLYHYSQRLYHRVMRTPFTHYRYLNQIDRPRNDTRPDANSRIKMKHQMNLIRVQLEYRFQLHKTVSLTICSETLSQILAPGVISGCGTDKNSVLEAACRRLSSVNQDRRHIMTGDIIFKNTVHVARAILLSYEQQHAWDTSPVGF